MKNCLFTILLFSFLSLNAQERARITVDIPTNQKPWNHTELNNNPENFQFAIVTDRTGGHRPGVFPLGISKLNLLQPEFVMSVGDLIEGYTTDTARLNAEWKEFTGFIDELEMPFFYVPGNHDITNPVMEDKWKELFGVTYYHFVYRDVLFMALNSEDNIRGSGRGTIDTEQYEYIKKVLEENKDVKWTLLFMHQPLWVQEDTKRWKDVEELLKDRPHNVFAGHYHRYWKTARNNGKYIALATTGGGSRLRGVPYGEFDHVVWVTMTDDGPLLANLLLQGVWDEDVVTDELVKFVRERPFPISIEPAFVDEKKQEEVVAQVRVRNDSDYRMSIEIDGRVHNNLHYNLSEDRLMLEPNTMEMVTLMIRNVDGIDVTATDPIQLDMKAIYDYPGRPELAVEETLNFSAFYKNRVGKAVKKVKVDGNLKEWDGEFVEISGSGHIDGNRFHYNGENDVSMKFATSYDDDNIYIAVEVTDDDLYTVEGEETMQQDALIVGFDGRKDVVSMYNQGDGMFEDWLVIVRSLTKKGNIYNQDALPEGIATEVRKTDSGFTAEVAIPVSYLSKLQGGDWTSFRLGIGYYDYDKGGEESNTLFWYPPWNTGRTVNGSGMHYRLR